MTRPPAYGRADAGVLHRTLALALALAFLPMTPAFSQAEEPLTELEEVTITGSRINTVSGMDTPTPVAAIGAAELAAMSPGALTEAMSQIPQFYFSATAANFNTGQNGFFLSPGGGSLNLRGVGSKRTLTLLDGRRIVPASIYGGPDINMFPETMLRTVETVTGGASAAYGTDAVSGVVNYILDTRFEGFRAHAQTGQTTRGDGDNAEYSLAFGTRLGDRTRLLFSAELARQDPIRSFEGRGWYQGWGMVQTGDGVTAPRFTPAPYVVSRLASYDGVVSAWQPTDGNSVPPAFGPAIFGSDGTLSAFQFSDLTSAANNSQSVLGGGSGTNNTLDRPNLLASQRRSNAFAYLSMEVGGSTEVYAQALFSDQKLRAANTPGDFQAAAGQPMTIFADNAFLPQSVRDAMAANEVASFTFGRIGHSSDIGFDSFVTQTTQTRSGTIGFRSEPGGGPLRGWTLDGYYQFGKTDVDAGQSGIRIDRLYMALDAVTDPATGQVVCNVTLQSGLFPDCVPLNLFGRGNASQAAIDWVTGFDRGIPVTVTPYLPGYPPHTYSYVSDGDKHRVIDIRQHVAELTASGELAAGWAGPISAAFGAHYRKEALDQKVQAAQGNPAADPFFYPVLCNDANMQAPTLAVACQSQLDNGQRGLDPIGIRGVPNGALNNSVEFQFSKVPFARGSYDIKELFAESLVPLVSGEPWMQRLNLNAAVRWADYGGSGIIWTYKAGLDATFTDELRVRGTYSRDVRAANLSERFDRTGGATSVTDPRTGDTVNVTIVSGGNPEVKPEVADTYTVGFVYRPRWFEGFDFSADWLRVSLDDSIESFATQSIVNACFIDNDPTQCANIQLDPVTDAIFIVNQSFQNVSKARISGIDFEMGYGRPVTLLGGGERIGMRIFASYLDENSTTSAAGIKTDRAGQIGNVISVQNYTALPQWKATANVSYTRGPFRAFVQARYIGDGKYDTLNAVGDNPWLVADNTIGSVTYFDTRVSYQIPAGPGSLEVYGNVTNLFDRDPPVIPAFDTFLAAPLQFNSTLHDVLGRRFVVGFNLRF